MVDGDKGKGSDNREAFKEIRVMWLSPAKKAEIWALHKEDPVVNNTLDLAHRFGVREDRIKGVIVLQRKREEFVAELGVLNPEWTEIYDEYLRLHKDHKDTSIAAKADLLASGVRCFKCGEEHFAGHAGFAAHKKVCPNMEGPASPEGDEARARYNAVFHPSGWEKKKKNLGMTEVRPNQWEYKKPVDTHPGYEPVLDAVVEAVATSTKKGATEVAKIVDAMSKHQYALRLEQKEADRVEELMGEYVEAGATVAETATTGARKGALEDYYPLLFGDEEGFEDYRADLIRRIEEETKAETEVGSGAEPVFLRMAERLAAAAPADAENTANVPTAQLGRWKWAFRDLSKKSAQPTMVRTRRGDWRQASPLEEAQRSWVRIPTQVDMEIHREKIKQWLDPDSDEAEVQKLVLEKTARRKAQLAEAKN